MTRIFLMHIKEKGNKGKEKRACDDRRDCMRLGGAI